ncbi:MAG: carbohydrate-binding domain-containing protein [Lachnospiraceae bacterium]
MMNAKIRKGTALLLAALIAGTAACGKGNGGEGNGNEPTPTIEAQDKTDEGAGKVTNTPTGTEESKEVTETPSSNAAAVTPAPEISTAIKAVKESEVTESAERTASITLSDSGIAISGSGCEADGSRLKIKEAGTYELTGTLTNGSIYVNVDNESEVHLILNGVTIHNETSAAIFCKKAAKVTITLAEGSVNTLSDGAEYVFEEGEDEPDATLYAKHDLVINGSGALKVTSAYGDAVKGKDSLYILGGDFTVSSADDGIIGRDLLYIADGTFSVVSASDALKATNDTDAALGNIVIDGGTFNLVAETDGIQAENTLLINGGTFSIKTGGGAENASVKTEESGFGAWGKWGDRGGMVTETETAEASASAKGLKAATALTVNGGTFELDTSDDALHSNKEIQITGGEFRIASGDDGVHADESLSIEGNSKLWITKSYEGLEALTITLSGGEIDITASDDGLNAAGGADGSAFGRPGAGMFAEGSGEIFINGGNVTVNASGDGIDSNGNITMNGGTVLAYGPTNDGNGVLDYGGSFQLNGGTLLCIGSSGMAQTPANTSGQYSLAAVLASEAAAGSTIEITVNGKSVLSTEAPKRFNYIVASTADFTADAEVGILVNGEESYAGALTEVVTCFGTTGGMMGGFGGGMMGGFGGGKGGMGRQPGGELPDFSNGEMPERSNGERPEQPDGKMQELPNGKVPELPGDEV